MAVHNISANQAKVYLDEHSLDTYVLVDVRQDWEYEEFHIPGARLIPLAELYDRMEELDPKIPVLVYCRSGNRSIAAAGLLDGQGYFALNIVGGIMAWKNEYAVGPTDQGMAHYTGEETPLEVLRIAYGMEQALEWFYQGRAERTDNAELKSTFERLANMEDAHRLKVLKLAKQVDTSIASEKDLIPDARELAAELLEGGMTADEFLATHEAYLDTSLGALDTAMMFEAQALDLYMRYADKATDKASADILHELAAEEKMHLSILARLMRKDVVEKKGQSDG